MRDYFGPISRESSWLVIRGGRVKCSVLLFLLLTQTSLLIESVFIEIFGTLRTGTSKNSKRFKHVRRSCHGSRRRRGDRANPCHSRAMERGAGGSAGINNWVPAGLVWMRTRACYGSQKPTRSPLLFFWNLDLTGSNRRAHSMLLFTLWSHR